MPKTFVRILADEVVESEVRGLPRRLELASNLPVALHRRCERGLIVTCQDLRELHQ